MGIRLVSFAACVAALTMAAGASFAKEVDLQRTDLRRLFVGNTLTMEHKNRITFQFTDRDGKVTQKFDAGGGKTGFWEIKGDRNPRICYEFPASVDKCYIVFRDDVSDDYYIYKYRNKRRDKLVFRVIRVREGNTIAPPPPKADETVRLSRKMLRRVQARLNKRGFDAGKPDGVMGRKTRNAIADFQRLIDEPATGKLTEDQLDRLLN